MQRRCEIFAARTAIPIRTDKPPTALVTVYRLSTNGGAEAFAIEISTYLLLTNLDKMNL